MIGWLALAEDAALLRCSSKAEARAEAIVAHAETIDGFQEKAFGYMYMRMCNVCPGLN